MSIVHGRSAISPQTTEAGAANVELAGTRNTRLDNAFGYETNDYFLEVTMAGDCAAQVR
jgi:hypothetical protein